MGSIYFYGSPWEELEELANPKPKGVTMNELQTIREAAEKLEDVVMAPAGWTIVDEIKKALAILEAREASFATAEEIVGSIIDNRAPDRAICAALIGQYAYRYSEDIRKDRDYWKKTAESLHDALLQHVENHKGECAECGAKGGGHRFDCSKAPWGKDGES